MLSLLLQLEVGRCPLARLYPRNPQAVQVQLPQGSISRGSLLRLKKTQRCFQDGLVEAEILSQVYFYQEKGKSLVWHRQKVCLDVLNVQDVQTSHFYGLAPPPDWEGALSGEMFRTVQDDGECNAETLSFEDKELSLSALSWLYVVDEHQGERIEEIQKDWFQTFGDWILGRVWLNDWNYLALPLEYYGKAQIEAEYAREQLNNPMQRNKAVIAKGPDSLWLHFLGTDARYSDVWGKEETIQRLIEISQQWNRLCKADDLVLNKASCVTQIGDLAWYNTRIPDPLGHRQHYKGDCIDLRLFRSDASRYEAYWNRGDDRKGISKAYDRRLTNSYIDFLWSVGVETVLFSDPKTNARWASRHNDHLHVCFPR
ncbi:MAG: hypothetical protein VX278_06325 [Myxococcota bacterium]|nr:hypothetical protein [Myxococcota bacterium]